MGAAETTPLSAPLGSLLRGDYHDLHCKFQADKRARALFEAPAKDNDYLKMEIEEHNSHTSPYQPIFTHGDSHSHQLISHMSPLPGH